MLAFTKKELGIDREYIEKAMEDNILYSELIDKIFDIEVEGIQDDGTVEERSAMAAKIVTLLCGPMPHPNEDIEAD